VKSSAALVCWEEEVLLEQAALVVLRFCKAIMDMCENARMRNAQPTLPPPFTRRMLHTRSWQLL